MVTVSSIDVIAQILDGAAQVAVITGAGCSTPSGIGDYRDADGEWKRAAPVQHQDFMRSAQWRARYWARSQVGFPEFLQAQPNAAHSSLATLEQRGRLSGLITQNVDRLHQRAGHQHVIDLHGRLDRVVCMNCGHRVSRSAVQQFLDATNKPMDAQLVGLAPDGDADIEATDFSHIVSPSCTHCDGILKPDVVFYGDSVPKHVVQQGYDIVDSADAVLIVGTSLMVYSSFRFVRRAHARGVPIVAINQGKTRADDLIQAKAQGNCADLMPQLLTRLAW